MEFYNRPPLDLSKAKVVAKYEAKHETDGVAYHELWSVWHANTRFKLHLIHRRRCDYGSLGTATTTMHLGMFATVEELLEAIADLIAAGYDYRRDALFLEWVSGLTHAIHSAPRRLGGVARDCHRH